MRECAPRWLKVPPTRDGQILGALWVDAAQPFSPGRSTPQSLHDLRCGAHKSRAAPFASRTRRTRPLAEGPAVSSAAPTSSSFTPTKRASANRVKAGGSKPEIRCLRSKGAPLPLPGARCREQDLVHGAGHDSVGIERTGAPEGGCMLEDVMVFPSIVPSRREPL